MQYLGTILWFLLLLAVQLCSVHETDPYCKRNIKNSIFCSNWNSTNELNYNIVQLASKNNINLEKFKQLSVVKSYNFLPNNLGIAPYLEHLAVIATDITPMFEGFSKCTSLEHLNIHSCQLDINENTFHGLNKLNTLDLLNNNISCLPENWQNGLTSLVTLAVPDNNLRTLDDRPFKQLYHLESLDLIYNNIREISPNTFQELTHLFYLHLNNNKIVKLPKGVFNGLHALVSLDISGNTIDSLEPEIFKDLANLENLILYSNAIKTLKQSNFVGLNKLGTLKMSYNQIGELPTYLFKHLPQIQTIVLEYNKIEHVRQGAFKGLKRLKNVYLSNNNIGRFPSDAFDGNSVVSTLVLSNNRIRGLDNIDCKTLLQNHDLGKSQPESLNCSNFKELAQLTILSLENNTIMDLTLADLRAFPKLHYIQLNGNKLDPDVLNKIYKNYNHL